MNRYGRSSVMPPVLKTLLILNVSVFALQFFIFPSSINHLLMKFFALWPITGTNLLEPGSFWPWQLITYQFMHSLSTFLHVGFNMFALWMFGAELENMWGSKKFLFYYLLCGIGAGVIHLFISPLFNEPLPTIGASGAVYGILLAFGLTFPNRSIFMFPFFIPIPAKIFVIIFAAIELIAGLSGRDGIAHFAHLGGAFTGFILLRFAERWGIYRFFEKFFKSDAHYRSYFSQKYTEEPKPTRVKWVSRNDEEFERSKDTVIINGEQITQQLIDEILDKISVSGYQNLTEREKKILFELSQRLK